MALSHINHNLTFYLLLSVFYLLLYILIINYTLHYHIKFFVESRNEINIDIIREKEQSSEIIPDKERCPRKFSTRVS